MTGDAALSAAVRRHADQEALDSLVSLGAEAGTTEAQEHGRLANRFHPELIPYDRYGNRIDEVAFHPSWHWLMDRAVGHGLAAATWVLAEKGAEHTHVRRAAGFLAWSRTEPGHLCPTSMTYAAVPALRAEKSLSPAATSWPSCSERRRSCRAHRTHVGRHAPGGDMTPDAYGPGLSPSRSRP